MLRPYRFAVGTLPTSSVRWIRSLWVIAVLNLVPARSIKVSRILTLILRHMNFGNFDLKSSPTLTSNCPFLFIVHFTELSRTVVKYLYLYYHLFLSSGGRPCHFKPLPSSSHRLNTIGFWNFPVQNGNGLVKWIDKLQSSGFYTAMSKPPYSAETGCISQTPLSPPRPGAPLWGI